MSKKIPSEIQVLKCIQGLQGSFTVIHLMASRNKLKKKKKGLGLLVK